jgi:hypothetical protein
MASHRKLIRKKVVDILKAKNGIAGQKVFPARILPIQSLEELPCLLVYTSDEKSEANGDALFLLRNCTLSIEGAVNGSEDEIDDLLDDLSDQVEEVIDADPRLAGLLHKDLVLTSTASEVGKQGHEVIAGFRLDFTASYMTRRTADEFPVVTAPNKVWTDPHASPEEYADILGSNPVPVSNSETACGPDGCDLPFYQGELNP